jgi:four helix bundle protein
VGKRRLLIEDNKLSAISFQLSAQSVGANEAQSFHDLKVWQKAHALTLAVYRATATFPREELYGLTSQRRSCSSIPANLAGGCGRTGDAEFARFCSIAMGSASELEYHLLLARDLKLIQPKDHEELSRRTAELKRMLTALRLRLKADC